MESKSVDELMDNNIFKPASPTCDDEKTKFKVYSYLPIPAKSYPKNLYTFIVGT